MPKTKLNRHVFHFGIPGQVGTVSIPVPTSRATKTIKITRTVADVLNDKSLPLDEALARLVP